MDERDEVHLPPPPAARCSTEVNRRSNVSASEEDEGVKLQPRCYNPAGRESDRSGGREGVKITGERWRWRCSDQQPSLMWKAGLLESQFCWSLWREVASEV